MLLLIRGNDFSKDLIRKHKLVREKDISYSQLLDNMRGTSCVIPGTSHGFCLSIPGSPLFTETISLKVDYRRDL
jgi:6-phosphogluconate dehydrogenase (decarboxylating)